MRALYAPFMIDSTGRVQSTTDLVTIVEQQIINILVTNKKERTMRPFFGGNVQGLMFEPVDQNVFADREADLATMLNENLRLARVVQVKVRSDWGNAMAGESTRTSLYVDVTYFIPPADQSVRSLTVSFNNILNQESGI